MTDNDRGPARAPSWQRRHFLLALGALAGCGGGGSDADDLLVPGTKLFDLQFVDAQRAYGVGKQGLVARTDDGGQTWRRLRVDSTANLTSVFPVNRQLVIASSDDEAVLRTVDGGANWQAIRQGYGSPVHTARVAFAPDADHVALRIEGNLRWGGVNHLKITTNGGRDWLTTLPPDSQIPWAPRFTRSGFLFILYGPISGGAQPLWVSDDFGRSFRQTPLSGVTCGTFGEQGIWLQVSAGGAGSPATITLSQDGFLTWTEVHMQVDGLAAEAQPRMSLLTLDAAGRGWAVTQQGYTATGLLHSSDGGRRWTAVAAPEVSPLNGRAIDGMSYVTYGDNASATNSVAQMFTTDAGASWRRFDAPANAMEVAIVRDAAGGLLAKIGSLQAGYSWQRSTDDGRTWRTLL